MPIDILMPALSPTMEAGTLAKWLVKPGDAVQSGDVIAEIETDKATMEVEAVDEGTVGQILVEAGTENVAVNALIAVLLEEGEGEDALASSNAKSNAKSNISSATAFPSQGQTAPVSNAETSPAKPVQNGAAGPQIRDASGHIRPASPLARRLAKVAGIDLSAVVGSGPKGRIVKADIEKVQAGAASASAATAAASAAPAASSGPGPQLAAAMSDDQILKLFDPESYEVRPHDGMRRTIARRLTEAKQSVPHFYLTLETRIDKLLALRAELNAAAPKDSDGKPAFKISVNDLVIKAHALALKAVPEANASWSDGGMLIHKSVDVGVAVAIEGGLITPIIRGAEAKSISSISAEMKDLAARARARKLAPSEYQGGTTAVSNLGMFGIKDFCAVINPPHATILAVGAGLKQPVVDGETVTVGTVMNVTLSTDHRAVDGALGAELLAAFKGYIENPLSMLV